jgi:hypothetical protein
MKIVIVTDGTADGTEIEINGHQYADITDFGFTVSGQDRTKKPGKAKLHLKRAVPNGPDAVSHLYGMDFVSFDRDNPPPEPVPEASAQS